MGLHHLPAFFTSSFNPGTSGSVQDFLNAIFYPNSAPSITTGNQTISEYSASNAQIVQLVATDPEGQTLTFGTGSSYTVSGFYVEYIPGGRI